MKQSEVGVSISDFVGLVRYLHVHGRHGKCLKRRACPIVSANHTRLTKTMDRTARLWLPSSINGAWHEWSGGGRRIINRIRPVDQTWPDLADQT